MHRQEEPAPDETNVELEAQKRGNSYVLVGARGTVGEMTYHFVDVDTWIVDSTYIDPAYRGQQLAKRLLDYVVDEARDKGRKIIPSCSYVLEQFKRDPQYADVWERREADYADPYSSRTLGMPGR
ncbi:GNAT family N-acetyltransferase [Paenibacillus hodogayensis]|uniref:GNAT family N-acetyltransferase n=1 Tax=Paenibacillus hodogayensis TaxID=279208 RepID=A0ABV5VWF1_9BACL